MQGRSLIPLLDGEPPDNWRTWFFVEHLFDHPNIPKHEGIRGPRYKYARYFEQDPMYEVLYDMESDPLESTNLALSPDHLPLLNQLRSRTDSLVSLYGSQALGTRGVDAH